MILISVNIPKTYLLCIERLVSAERFPNRAEIIRVAIRDMIKEEFYRAQYDMRGSDFNDLNNITYVDDDGLRRSFRVVKKLD